MTHRIGPATQSRGSPTFRSRDYLARLMAELDRAEISLRIAQAREQAGLTQPELAELVEPPVHWRTVQDWESPKNANVPWNRLGQIAEATRVTKEWILHGDAERVTEEERLDALQQELAEVRGMVARVLRRLGEEEAEPQEQRRAGGERPGPAA
jgi:transcriptional regulator with XRE-family HTH domain